MPLTLKFGPGEPTGFTGYTMASLNGAPPAKILREILQNSLDAAVEASEKTAKVRFEISLLQPEDLPDVRGYRRAFEAAVKYHRRKGPLSDPAKQVVDTINAALKDVKAGQHYMLSVLDNGIGFDESRMTAVLSDGSSNKQEGATGSYGVGHFSSVSASDLHYVLYGGVSKNGERIASGFTILAGRSGNRRPRSARGYLVKELLSGKGHRLFRFATNNEVPSVIGRQLDEVQRRWGHGSAVMIPAFNYFGRVHEGDKWLIDLVKLVVSFNFSAAIHARQLVVEIDEAALGGETITVDRSNLGTILKKEGERVRVFRRDSWYSGLRPSGQMALAAFRTLSQGRRDLVPTKIGKADVRLMAPTPTGRTRLDLFRNGMWITDDVPELDPSVFADWEPFHAVLMPIKHSKLHRLIRKAEGPMHDQLTQSNLSLVEREDLETACRAIASWIKTNVPKRATEETYTPDDFLVFSSGGEDGVGGTGNYSMWGRPVIVQSARLTQVRTGGLAGKETKVENERKDGVKAKAKPRNRREATQRSRPLPFRSTAVPSGKGRYSIEIECHEAFHEVLLRFRVDENTDATCDRLWPDEEIVLRSFKATNGDGKELKGELEEGNTTVRLRGLAVGACKIAIEYEAPAGFDDTVRAPVFRVDLHKPQD